MAVRITTSGNGRRMGRSGEISSYRVSEDATPLHPGDNVGGIGGLDFTGVPAIPLRDSLMLIDDSVRLEDGSNGSTAGVITGVSINSDGMQVTADSRLSLLVAPRDVGPYVGNLGGVVAYWLSLVGIVDDFVVDTEIFNTPIAHAGWSGDLWFGIKQSLSAVGAEIALVSGVITVRPVRQRFLERRKESVNSIEVSVDERARFVEVAYYNNREIALAERVYPATSEIDEASVYQVDADGILEFEIEVNASLDSVVQPIAVDAVPYGYTGGTSQYSVLDREGIPYPAATWTSRGGKVEVEILPSTTKLLVRITGPTDLANGPFRLAQATPHGGEGSRDVVSTIYICGTGVGFDRKLLRSPTSAPEATTSRDSGVTIDAPTVSTLADAYRVASLAAAALAGYKQGYSATATVVNRPGEKGSVQYITFGEFDALHAGLDDFGDFDTQYVGMTFADFDAQMGTLTDDTFENQAFGNVAGARVRRDDAVYRVRSATISESSISYDAEMDTTFADFDAEWEGATFADFDDIWTGHQFRDHAVAPLRTAAPTADDAPTGGDLFPGSDEFPGSDVFPG